MSSPGWTKGEDDILIARRNVRDVELAALLGRGVSAIRHRRMKLCSAKRMCKLKRGKKTTPVNEARLRNTWGGPEYWVRTGRHIPNRWDIGCGQWEWIPRRRWNWELENGPVPKGYQVIRLNNDTTNDDLDNLVCIPRGVWQTVCYNYSFRSMPDDRNLRLAVIFTMMLDAKIEHVEKTAEEPLDGRTWEEYPP